MRQRMIEALTYPRIVLMSNLEDEACPHNLMFNASHESCKACGQGDECQWLNMNDEFSVLAQKPMDSLYASLEFCIDYVQARCTRSHHNVPRCACESCEWVRTARRLAMEYRHMKQPLRRSAQVGRY